jgi:hypothetical protein
MLQEPNLAGARGSFFQCPSPPPPGKFGSLGYVFTGHFRPTVSHKVVCNDCVLLLQTHRGLRHRTASLTLLLPTLFRECATGMSSACAWVETLLFQEPSCDHQNTSFRSRVLLVTTPSAASGPPLPLSALPAWQALEGRTHTSSPPLRRLYSEPSVSCQPVALNTPKSSRWFPFKAMMCSTFRPAAPLASVKHVAIRPQRVIMRPIAVAAGQPPRRQQVLSSVCQHGSAEVSSQ